MNNPKYIYREEREQLNPRFDPGATQYMIETQTNCNYWAIGFFINTLLGAGVEPDAVGLLINGAYYPSQYSGYGSGSNNRYVVNTAHYITMGAPPRPDTYVVDRLRISGPSIPNPTVGGQGIWSGTMYNVLQPHQYSLFIVRGFYELYNS